MQLTQRQTIEQQPKRTNRLKTAELNLRAYMVTTALVQLAGDRELTAAYLGITRMVLNVNIRRFRIDVAAIQNHAKEAKRKKAAACANAPYRIPVKNALEA